MQTIVNQPRQCYSSATLWHSTSQRKYLSVLICYKTPIHVFFMQSVSIMLLILYVLSITVKKYHLAVHTCYRAPQRNVCPAGRHRHWVARFSPPFLYYWLPGPLTPALLPCLPAAPSRNRQHGMIVHKQENNIQVMTFNFHKGQGQMWIITTEGDPGNYTIITSQHKYTNT